MGYKMKGWSGYQNSPMKQTKEQVEKINKETDSETGKGAKYDPKVGERPQPTYEGTDYYGPPDISRDEADKRLREANYDYDKAFPNWDWKKETPKGEHLKPNQKSPAKHGTMTRMSDPPQYPKHRHGESKHAGVPGKAIMTGGWTTDPGAQHTNGGGASREQLKKIMKKKSKSTWKELKGAKESPAKQIEPKGGETYTQYLDRAFKGTKDPYAQDVSGRKWEGKYEGPKTKRSYKKATKKATKRKVIKKVGGKLLSRAIPGAGWALLASDIYGIGKKMKKGKTFKKAVKKQFLGLD